MNQAPDFKYTDRDVREDDSLLDLAVEYVMEYRGDFEPLVDARQYFADHDNLPVAMARRVLNCMRHDREVAADLPTPKRNSNLVDFSEERAVRRPKKRKKVSPCPDKEPHHVHFIDYETGSCPGVPWPINRRPTHMKVKIKRPFAVAKSGALIHKVEQDGNHTTYWTPPQHAWGWRDYDRWSDCDLTVKLACKFPSYIRNPFLLNEDEVDEYIRVTSALKGRHITMCQHCLDAAPS